MGTVLIILLVVAILLATLGFYKNNNKVMATAIAVFAICVTLTSCVKNTETQAKAEQDGVIVDLPEEYQAISTSPVEPDTLVGYYINDTLHITFIGEHR